MLLPAFFVRSHTVAALGERFGKGSKGVLVVGLGRFELPTTPLSGVRSNQLSYRPASGHSLFGGADRDRTGGLLNANQALSQLSYSPLYRGRLDAGPGTSPNPKPITKTEVENCETIHGVERLSLTY